MEIKINRLEPDPPPIDSVTIEFEPYEFRDLLRLVKSGLKREGLSSTPLSFKLESVFNSASHGEWNRSKVSE